MSDNYEKAALGGGAVVALALAFFGWSASSGVDNELINPATGRGNTGTDVPGAELLPGALSSMQAEHSWQQVVLDERPLDLFTGIALFAREGSSDPTDIFKDKPVHPPIGNRWFLDHRIDIGFSDSAERDPDGDGFSNLEEFKAETLPGDPRSHPELIAKLTYQSEEVKTWLLWFSMDIDGKYQFKYRHQDAPGEEFTMKDMAAPGDILVFRKPGPCDGRFRLLKVEEREVMNERIQVLEQKKFAIIEDLKENKKGDQFEVPRRMPNAVRVKHIRRDRTAVLELQAVGCSGKPFRIEERKAFSLPPGGPEKKFILKEVNEDSITVVTEDAAGQKRELVIPMGGFPDLDS